MQVRTTGLMPCDSVVLSRDGARLGLLSKSETQSGDWDGFSWAVGNVGPTQLQAYAYNWWFTGVCSVSCNVSRACSLMSDLTLEGGQVTWSVRSFAFAVGHRYNVVLWESDGPWWLTLGQYSWGNGRWDTVTDTVRLDVGGSFLNFSPSVTDSYDLGWRAQEGSTGRFLIFDLSPGGQR